jgi:3-oxoacyl-[acyl-carrier protein] reductase
LRATLAWLKGRGNRGGVVVNIGSAAARLPSRDIAYASSKAALEGLTRALAKSLAPENISVFCIAPGVVDTAMSQAMPVRRRDEHLERTWLKRPCMPEEVADLVLYLITGKTAFLTGSVIGMSGGLVCT